IINSNLLQNVDQKLLENSIIIANLPYVPNEYRLNKAAYHEPSLAIFGGKDGLDIYRKLFEQINSMRQADYIITECLKFQHNSLRKLAEANDYIEIARKNLIQLFTVRGRPQE
ncbi:hypothetical protein KDA11_03515, partial [Candidatus Saccharibacteria bacterium]|nr:hypothetical protein [Candidatus Saccharibacteria bacterium]